MSPKPSSFTDAWDMAILIPSGERGPEVCHELIQSQRKFCCLIPSDLVSWVPYVSNQRNPDVESKLNACHKISFLDCALTWVVSGFDCPTISSNHAIFATSVGSEDAAKSPDVYGPNGKNMTDATTKRAESVGDVYSEWPLEQAAELFELKRNIAGEVTKMGNGLYVVIKEGDTAKILVPFARREALIRLAHESTQHQSWKKVLIALRKQYEWHGMPSQVKRIVETCSSCAIIKARRNLSHGQFSSMSFSGPRMGYAIDFYEVGESAAGFKWILTIIDMFSREVMFVPMKSREADEVVRELLRNLINVKGIPISLLSDEAREFTSKILNGLIRTLGVKRVTTRAYNARANGICERVHEFLGECLTRLAVEERSCWEHRVSEFSFAHNTAFHETLGCSPFELGHGTEARTMLSSIAQQGAMDVVDVLSPSELEVRGYFGRLKAAAAVYNQIAKTNISRAQAEQNAQLNDGSRVRTYTVGDNVSIYFPKKSLDSGWKQKHTPQWRGPMVITSHLSPTSYAMKDTATDQVFERTVMNIQPYRAPLTSGDSEIRVVSALAKGGDLMTGDMVALNEGNDFWIGELKSVDAEEVSVNYWATTGRNVASAVFKPAFIGAKSGKTILCYRLKKNEEQSAEWTGVCDLESVICKVNFNIDRKGNHRLTAGSRGR